MSRKGQHRTQHQKTDSNSDRLLPHSPEAEKGVLGCILLSPDCLKECRDRIGTHDVFYDLRHREIYRSMIACNGSLDPITLIERLKTAKKLEDVGGDEYVLSLQDFVPSAANLPRYLDILLEKYKFRRIINACTAVVGRIYDHSGPDISDLMFATRSDLLECLEDEDDDSSVLRFDESLNYNVEADPNAVIGVKEGRTTRYLCRGYGAWIIGPSGIGKSSFVYQMACNWALARDVFGIRPVKPLRCLIVQAENDAGDIAEMTQGARKAMGLDEEFHSDVLAALNDRVIVVTERRRIGEQFCSWLGRTIQKHRADIVFGDPFLSFAGIDVSKQDQCSKFLRCWLNPVLADTGAVMIGAHHTGKPKSSKETRNWSAIDHAYAGIGSSELVNWARAIMVIAHHKGESGDRYELMLLKRGERAAAIKTTGEFTKFIWMRHSEGKIWWEQVDAPAAPEPSERKGGKPDQKREIAYSNLFGFISGCKGEGEGLNEISKRLAAWLAKEHKDVSLPTCKRIIPLLVENQKLSKNDSLLYVKGPNS